MASPSGHFVWYELMTPDTTAAKAFYTSVIGWTASNAGMDNDYWIFSAGDAGIAGVMRMPPQAAANGAQTGWRGYIGVADTDEALARVKAAGGTLHYGPEDIPTVGRFASVTDGQGAPFLLFTPMPASPRPHLGPGTPGTIGWHGLYGIANLEQAFSFYSGLFGWQKGEAYDMGPNGTYQTFSQNDATPTGGMAAGPGPARWQFYINVADVVAAEPRVKAEGGTVLFPPHQVPGGLWILHAKDPQGADFALVSPPPA